VLMFVYIKLLLEGFSENYVPPNPEVEFFEWSPLLLNILDAKDMFSFIAEAYYATWIVLSPSRCVDVTNLLNWTVFTQLTNSSCKSTTG
jgi:hypothetical protein